MKSLKKALLTLMILVIGAGAANAQFKFGVKAGANFNSIHLKDAKQMFNPDNGTGWEVGVMTEFQVPIVGLCLDLSLMYARMNADVNVVTTDENGNPVVGTISNKNFIDIPLNIKYKFSLPVVGSFLAPYVFTGPDFAFKLGKGIFNDMKTRTCQVAWNVGLGLEFIKRVQIGASYGFGINNIAKNWVNATTDIKAKNNYWTVTAAYLF